MEMNDSGEKRENERRTRWHNFMEEEEEEEHFLYASQLMNSMTLPMVLNAAIQLGVLEVIAKAGPRSRLSAQEIASRIRAHNNPNAPTMLDRMLRLLASYSVITCEADSGEGGALQIQRVYGLAPVAKYFVPNQDGVSLGPVMSLLQDKVFVESWFELKDAVLEGGVPFDRVHGMHAFEYPGKDPRFNEVFNKAMVNSSTIIIKKIIERYKGFEHLPSLVDVGGGLGVTLSIITSKFPSIKGINFDLPHVIQHAPPYPGVKHIEGDMFESVPKGDAVFMKRVLHDWSDDHCLKLLKNCYRALPEKGKVIVVEAILQELPGASAAEKITSGGDLVMMTQNPGGKERTEQGFLALAIGAGFQGIRLDCFVCNHWVMEFYK